MAERKRRKKLFPKDFIEKYGPAIEAGRKADEQPREAPKLTRNAFRGDPTFYSLGQFPSKVVAPAVPWDELRDSWIAQLLHKAEIAREPEAFKALLLELLTGIDVQWPEGVFVEWPKALGARKKDKAETTRAHWAEIGKPTKLNAKVCDELAKFTYPEEYAKAKPYSKRRKKLRDRVARQVRLLLQKEVPITLPK